MPPLAALANRSRTGVVNRLRGLRSSFENDLLLPAANLYRISTSQKISSTPPLTPPYNKQLADYIACSSILHLADAWSYMSAAYLAASFGDEDVATHLGYYAELRACLALLATQGIGVFKNVHYLVGHDGRAQTAGSGSTHEYCWSAFQQWANSDGWQEISALVRPSGVPISEWLNHFPSFGAAPAVGANMLQHFGLDIGRAGSDRDLRNEASYRPTAFRYLKAGNSAEEAVYRAEAIAALVSPGRFGDCPLVTAILSSILANCFESRHGMAVNQNLAMFANEVDQMLHNSPVPNSPTLKAELLAYATHSLPMLSDAQGVLPSDQWGHHRQVLARATILCFISNLFVRQLADDAGVTTDDLDFWMTRYASERGVYTTMPDPMSDLWADILEAIENTKSEAVSTMSQQVMEDEIGTKLLSLCRLERLFFLGMCT